MSIIWIIQVPYLSNLLNYKLKQGLDTLLFIAYKTLLDNTNYSLKSKEIGGVLSH